MRVRNDDMPFAHVAMAVEVRMPLSVHSYALHCVMGSYTVI